MKTERKTGWSAWAFGSGNKRCVAFILPAQFLQQGMHFPGPDPFGPFKRTVWIVSSQLHRGVDLFFCTYTFFQGNKCFVDDHADNTWCDQANRIWQPGYCFMKKRKKAAQALLCFHHVKTPPPRVLIVKTRAIH